MKTQSRKRCLVELVNDGRKPRPVPVVLPERFVGRFRDVSDEEAYEMGTRAAESMIATFKRAANLILFALFACFAGPSSAADFQVVGYVTITNVPAGASTNIVFSIGTSDTRTFTNGVVTPSTSIQITNSTAATRTQLVAHVTTYPVYAAGVGTPQIIPIYSATNTSVIEFWAPVNTNLSISFGGNWARVYYETNPFNLSNPILVDTNRMSANARTNAVNAIANFLAATNVVPSNSIPPGAKVFQHYTDQTSSQTLSNKTFTSPVMNGGRIVNTTNLTGTNVALTNVVLSLAAIHNLTELNGYLGTLTNGVFWSNLLQRVSISNAVIIGGNVYRFTNGYWTNAVLDSPKATNLVSYSSISAPGSGTASEQFGSGAHAYSDFTSAFGYQAFATNDFSTAIGYQATAFGGGAVVGAVSSANTNTATLGYGNSGSGVNGTLVGNNNDANGYYNVILIGSGLNASEDNEVIIGGGSGKVSISGALTAATLTNSTIKGTTAIPGRIDLTSVARTSLANGYNSGTVLGTNVYIRLSGASAAATNAGFAAGVDGTLYLVQVDNPGLSYTVLNESGLEATAANRVVTSTGALMNSTNNPVLMQLLYDATASRYRVLTFR